MNSADEILKAFKTYYDTAELEAVTDPETSSIICGEARRDGLLPTISSRTVVASVEVDPKSRQGDLVAAINPALTIV